jgi:hypothetical protein
VDFAVYKSSLPRVRRWPGTHKPVGVRPLSSFHLDQAHLAAQQPFKLRGIKPSGTHFHLLHRAEVLALGLCCPKTHQAIGDADQFLAVNDTAGIVALYNLWESVQEEHTPHCDALEAEIELQLRTKGPAYYEVGAVVVTKTPADFFGVPVRDITDGQLIYWTAIKNAHYETFEKDKDGCKGGKTTAALKRRARRLRTIGRVDESRS